MLSAVANDPIISSELGGVSLSASRSRGGLSGIQEELITQVNENDPLLGGDGGKRRKKKLFYRPRPLWYVT